MPPLRANRPPLPAALLVLAAAAVTLAGAWTFQALGLRALRICLKQRYPYYAALPLGGGGDFSGPQRADGGGARFARGAGGDLFRPARFSAAYHAGVEWKFWPGPTDCTGDFVNPASMEDFRKQLQNIHVVRCDEVALRIFGLSLAGMEFSGVRRSGRRFAAILGAERRPKNRR